MQRGWQEANGGNTVVCIFESAKMKSVYLYKQVFYLKKRNLIIWIQDWISGKLSLKFKRKFQGRGVKRIACFSSIHEQLLLPYSFPLVYLVLHTENPEVK